MNHHQWMSHYLALHRHALMAITQCAPMLVQIAVNAYATYLNGHRNQPASKMVERWVANGTKLVLRTLRSRSVHLVTPGCLATSVDCRCTVSQCIKEATMRYQYWQPTNRVYVASELVRPKPCEHVQLSLKLYNELEGEGNEKH